MSRTLAWVAEATGGRRFGADTAFGQIGTDTRRLPKEALFVALEGERFDGHAFVGQAAEFGAAAALVSRRVPVALPQVVVPDTHEALARMGNAWRRQFTMPVIAVTGSSGKTTVKELIASILGVERSVCSTRGNLNNDIGVPLTLMRLEATDEALVVEMGANHGGEIAHLAALAEPDVGVLTNAGAAHLEGFGSLVAVAAAKGELLDALPSSGTAVLNADDRFFHDWRARSRAGHVAAFGLVNKADFTVIGKPEFDDEGSRFVMQLPDHQRVEIRLPLLGMHSVMNALAATAAACAAGARVESVVAGLARAEAVGGRLKPMRGAGGCTVIDDAYNANPGSVRAALDYLGVLRGQRIFVFGDMAELGPQSVELHHEIGVYARGRCDVLIAVGALAAHAARAFGAGAAHVEDVQGAVAALRPLLAPGMTVLVKASRVMGLDRVASALVDVSKPDEEPPC